MKPQIASQSLLVVFLDRPRAESVAVNLENMLAYFHFVTGINLSIYRCRITVGEGTIVTFAAVFPIFDPEDLELALEAEFGEVADAHAVDEIVVRVCRAMKTSKLVLIPDRSDS